MAGASGDGSEALGIPLRPHPVGPGCCFDQPHSLVTQVGSSGRTPGLRTSE